jgi:hypothetical protein
MFTLEAVDRKEMRLAARAVLGAILGGTDQTYLLVRQVHKRAKVVVLAAGLRKGPEVQRRLARGQQNIQAALGETKDMVAAAVVEQRALTAMEMVVATQAAALEAQADLAMQAMAGQEEQAALIAIMVTPALPVQNWEVAMVAAEAEEEAAVMAPARVHLAVFMVQVVVAVVSQQAVHLAVPQVVRA